MGIYTSNRFATAGNVDYSASIPANEAYDASLGCAHILADCQANDMAIFEAAIYSDMNEVMSIHEGVEVVNENAFTNVLKKIKDLFIKLLAKIKGIFKAFLAKLAPLFTSGKDLVKKYHKQIATYTNWNNFKVKGIRIPKNNNIRGAIEGAIGFKDNSNVAYGSFAASVFTDIASGENVSFDHEFDDTNDEIKLAIFNRYYTGGNFKDTVKDYEDIEKELYDFLYDDKDILDEDKVKDGSFFSADWIKGVLNDDKWSDTVKKQSKNAENNINKIINNIAKFEDKLKNFAAKNDGVNIKGTRIAGTGTEDRYTDITANDGVGGITVAQMQKAVQRTQKCASCEQEVITKVTSLLMGQVKFANAQARKVWSEAAAWSSTSHKESVEYYDALGECAYEQVYSNMEIIG